MVAGGKKHNLRARNFLTIKPSKFIITRLTFGHQHRFTRSIQYASYASCGRRVRFTVWSFSRRASCLGERMETAAAHAVLAAARYDGGTDLSLLGGESGLLNEAGPLGKGCDEGALLLTQPSRPP